MGVIDLDFQGHFGHFDLELLEIWLVGALTRHRFGLESLNLCQACILVYSQLVLKMRVIDLDLQYVQGHFGHFDQEIWLIRTMDLSWIHQICIKYAS